MLKNYYNLNKKERVRIYKEILKEMNSKFRHRYSYDNTLKLIAIVIIIYIFLILIGKGIIQ